MPIKLPIWFVDLSCVFAEKLNNISVKDVSRNLSRPEKSLHLLINNPVTSLHIFLNPEYRLHLFYRMKRKRALLRSNSPGIIQSDEHINPLLGLHLIMDLLFICTSAKPNKTYAIATSSFFCLLI
jgi:hypothetical protein